MPARIILVRHGPSALIENGRAIDHAGVQRWREAYDSAGLRTGARPPRALIELTGQAAHVIASDLRRAVESAERLAPHRDIHVSELLREASLAVPRWPTRLPLPGWGMLIYVAWGYRIVRGTDPPELDRARAATTAEWLTSLVSDGSMAVVVTHGVFRRLVAGQLISRGWRGTSREGGYRHWSAWSFSGP